MAELSYKFVRSPNSMDAMPSVQTGIPKEGWHYIWPEYEKIENTDAQRMSHIPYVAHIERLYDYVNFSLLGIGTGLI